MSQFAEAQFAIAAYAFSALFNATGGNHRLLFLVAAVMLIVVLLLGVRPATKRNKTP